VDAAVDQPPRHDAEALRIEIAQIDDVDAHGMILSHRRLAWSAEYRISIEPRRVAITGTPIDKTRPRAA
jgi:hypothetical protein